MRLVDEEGKPLGVMSSAEAYEVAKGRGMDLIEVAPNAKPPTCKIMDYGKWKYETKKKERASRKKQTVVVVKEIKVRPRTDIHDLETKLKQAKKFIQEGNKVKVSMRFFGRELGHKENEIKMFQTIVDTLADIAEVELEPTAENFRQMFLILAPIVAGKKPVGPTILKNPFEKRKQGAFSKTKPQAVPETKTESAAEAAPEEPPEEAPKETPEAEQPPEKPTEES